MRESQTEYEICRCLIINNTSTTRDKYLALHDHDSTHFCIHSRYSSCIKATDNEYARNGYAFLLVKVVKKGKIYGARNLTPDFNRVSIFCETS